MSNEVDFSDPSGAGNFLERYNQARNAGRGDNATDSAQSTTPPTTPKTDAKVAPSSPASSSPTRSKSVPIRSTEAAKNVWGSVFHPLGRSPKSANRYDLGRGKLAGPGQSASEEHAKGSGIDLDDRQID